LGYCQSRSSCSLHLYQLSVRLLSLYILT
jgi:hypothetical protein